jgi:tetratricopeptide (TPR) repeat protein
VLYRNKNENDRAKNIFLSLTKEYPTSTKLMRSYYQLASIYFNQNQINDAKNYLEKLLDNSTLTKSEQENVYTMLIDIHTRYLNELEKKHVCRSVMQDMKITMDFLTKLCTGIIFFENEFAEAEFYLDRKNYYDAKKLYEKYLFIESDPDEKLKTLKKLSFIYRKLSDTEKEIELLTKLRELEKNIDIEERFAILNIKKNKDQDAIDILLKAYKDFIGEATTSDLLFYIAKIYFRNQDYANAINYYKTLIETYPNSTYYSDALFELGLIFYIKNDYASCVNIFSKIPDKDAFLYWKGKCLLALNKSEEAKIEFQKIIERSRDSYYALLSQEKLKINSGLVSEKNFNAKYITRIPKLTEQEREHLSKAELFTQLGINSHVDSELSLIVNNAANRQFSYYIGVLYYMAGLYNKAIRKVINLKQEQNIIPSNVITIKYPLAYFKEIEEIAKKYNIDPYLVLSIARQESIFQADAVSISGALGLLQIMPSLGETIASKLNMKKFVNFSLIDPKINITMSIYHLKELFAIFNNNLVLILSGYNAGITITKKWAEQIKIQDTEVFLEMIPYKETRTYIKLILTNYINYQKLYKNSTQALNLNNFTNFKP